MGIMTLGDLCPLRPKQELLASKNFRRDFSLDRNQAKCSPPKASELGQYAQERHVEAEAVLDLPEELSPDEQAMLSSSYLRVEPLGPRPQVHDPLGDQYAWAIWSASTGDDLLECKNFGVTSLNEVRNKLTQYNLKLRGD